MSIQSLSSHSYSPGSQPHSSWKVARSSTEHLTAAHPHSLELSCVAVPSIGHAGWDSSCTYKKPDKFLVIRLCPRGQVSTDH